MRVELRGYGLEVEDHGEGTPLLLLHGFPLSSEMWSPVRVALEQEARVITPDQRGFGGSGAPSGDYSMESLAADVIALADRLELEHFVLGGHSMGGYVAFRAAAAYPERLAGLVLVDTRAEADTEEGRKRRAASVERIRREGGTGFLDEFVPNLLGAGTRERAPRLLSELLAVARGIPDHVLVGCLEGMAGRPDSRALLPSLDLPALVVVGEEDAITLPATAIAMAEALPRATLAVIPGAGHTPPVERPVATGEVMTAFVRRHWPR
jgi:pimeloyl-ACP methyl ester carboxylesterase